MMLFYRIYQLLIAAPLLLVATVLTVIITSIASYVGLGRSVGYYVPCIWSRLFCLLTWVKVDVHGRENISKDRSYVFVANHQGAYDIFSVFGYLGHNFRWMMKIGLKNLPLIGYACRVSGQIYVDNSSPAAVRRTMADAEKTLRGGMSVVVFPEGARTLDGRMHRFKTGAFRLADEFGLPIVPLTIDGAYKVMPRMAKLPRPGHIIITIHKPIEATDGHHDVAAVMEQARQVIASSLPEEN